MFITSRYPTGRNFWEGDWNAFQLAEDSPEEFLNWKHCMETYGWYKFITPVNARGLGAVLLITRIGRQPTLLVKIVCNCRSHLKQPQCTQSYKHRSWVVHKLRLDILMSYVTCLSTEWRVTILAMSVVDDTGQEHTIEGGSLSVQSYVHSNKFHRTAEGLAPSREAVLSNLKIQLPMPMLSPVTSSYVVIWPSTSLSEWNNGYGYATPEHRNGIEGTLQTLQTVHA